MCSYANSVDPDTLRPITQGSDMLDLDLACGVAVEIAPHRTMINITGGEPFIWGKQLFAFLAHCRKRRVPTSVTTNGTLLSRVMDDLLAEPPDVLIVSIHGSSTTHDRIVGLPAFKMVDHGLSELFRLKGHDPYRLPLVVVNTVILADNLSELSDVAINARHWGTLVNNYQLVWMRTEDMHRAEKSAAAEYDDRFTRGHRVEAESFSPEQVWKAIGTLRATAAKHGIKINIYPNLSRSEFDQYFNRPEQPLRRHRALCAWLVGQIMPDGSVTACLGHSMGSIAYNSFLDIWNGPSMKEFRKRLRREGLLSICSRCCQLWRNE